MQLDLAVCRVRGWTLADVPPITRHANNRNIWANLRDRFPHPYTENDARTFIELMLAAERPTVWAIEIDGEAVGGIGIELRTDVERVSAEIGYWLSEQYWGRGVLSAVLPAVTEHVLTEFALLRLYALPFADNPASIRVLEKAGYEREGHLRRSAIKDGVVRDQLLYAAYR